MISFLFRACCFSIAIASTLGSLPWTDSAGFGSEAKTPTQTNVRATDGATPEEQLAKCLVIAKQGDILQAFELAQQAKAEFGTQRLFNVGYLNTLVTLVKEYSSEHDERIVKEVIQLVNALKMEKRYLGAEDPEAAFHFMQVLGRLSQLTMKVNEPISSSLRIQEGIIAGNLKSNPNYPRNALEALALPLVNMARGHAIENNQSASFDSLRQAVDVGYSSFDSIVDDELLLRVANKKQLADLVTELEPRYKKAVDHWSRTVLAEFNPISFHFDIPDVNSGRISKVDFDGKVVVVDLWATWCAPCRQGIPHLVKLQNQYRSQGVSVVGISMDNPEKPELATETVRDFMTQQKFNYRSGMGNQSLSNQIPGELTLPTILFLDRSGNVRFIARGYHDYAKINAITNILANENQPVRASMPYGN